MGVLFRGCACGAPEAAMRFTVITIFRVAIVVGCSWIGRHYGWRAGLVTFVIATLAFISAWEDRR